MRKRGIHVDWRAQTTRWCRQTGAERDRCPKNEAQAQRHVQKDRQEGRPSVGGSTVGNASKAFKRLRSELVSAAGRWPASFLRVAQPVQREGNGEAKRLTSAWFAVWRGGVLPSPPRFFPCGTTYVGVQQNGSWILEETLLLAPWGMGCIPTGPHHAFSRSLLLPSYAPLLLCEELVPVINLSPIPNRGHCSKQIVVPYTTDAVPPGNRWVSLDGARERGRMRRALLLRRCVSTTVLSGRLLFWCINLCSSLPPRRRA